MIVHVSDLGLDPLASLWRFLHSLCVQVPFVEAVPGVSGQDELVCADAVAAMMQRSLASFVLRVLRVPRVILLVVCKNMMVMPVIKVGE